jgi:quercetin dioxygenase-like cupin family protein
MGDAFMEFDLTAELERLKDEATWSTGQNARTLIKYDNLRVVLTALKAGATMPDHQTDGRVSMQVLSGTCWCGHRAARSIFAAAACWRSITESGTT